MDCAKTTARQDEKHLSCYESENHKHVYKKHKEFKIYNDVLMHLFSYLKWLAVASHTYLTFPTAQSYINRASYEEYFHV